MPLIDFTGLGKRHFEQGYHQIGQWWLVYRGPWWRPGYS
jgi:hypothetical protein